MNSMNDEQINEEIGRLNKMRRPSAGIPAGSQIIIPRYDLSIERTYCVEVPLLDVTANAKNPFVLNEILNPKGTGSVIITGIECYNSTQQFLSATGRPIVVAADVPKLSIVFKWGTTEFIFQFPYSAFNPTTNFGMVRRFKDKQISMTDSYIQVMQAGIPAGSSALVNFFYRPNR